MRRIFSAVPVDEKLIAVAVARLQRVKEIQQILVQQLTVLETMSSIDFLGERAKACLIVNCAVGCTCLALDNACGLATWRACGAMSLTNACCRPPRRRLEHQPHGIIPFLVVLLRAQISAISCIQPAGSSPCRWVLLHMAA